MALVYIAGYVTRKDEEYSEEEILDVTCFYASRYGTYLSGLDRGFLKIPDDKTCQWTFLSFIMFMSIKDKVCRNSLSRILLDISEFFELDKKLHHARILANIFLKNLCRASTPRDSKESSLKVLKLSI